MRVFLTGATGFIGSHIVSELLAAGHQVIGMTRSDAGAKSLAAAGVEVHRGTLEDLDSIIAGAQKADAVIHTAFNHDFSNFVANCETDRRVISAMGSVLKGSDRPLIITSGTGMGDAEDGKPASEAVFNHRHPNPRIASELEGQVLLEAGIDVRVVRLPQVHNTFKQGLVSPYIEMSREKGAAAYVNEGANCWPAAHVLDVAKLYAQVLDKGSKGERYHAVDEQGVAARDIAEAVATGLGIPAVSILPQNAQQHFGWFAMFAALDLQATGSWTQQRLGWKPTGVGLIEDLQNMNYSSADQSKHV
ncbi:SDR family oxidoreductase [Serratia sp. M24T3]|uniref:SDR family oxidoreductase n=1 Tax=Serratia sp. M24T3 TaxID=932213 RepID=UPI00025B9857|nr:SDR family oxidoreductase [Serratia sp. M24T3]EIC85923.1 NAD-dependent epimerase/dehydratase [Serratia sp. M24T3]